MRLTTLYGLVGLVWGVLLGGIAALAVMAMAAGVSWVFLFGDDPWPEAVGWVIPLTGLTAFLGALALCTSLGLRSGRRAASRPRPEAGASRASGCSCSASCSRSRSPARAARGSPGRRASACCSMSRPPRSRRCAPSVRC